MQKLPDTPSLAFYKSDAKVLLRRLLEGCPDAKKRLAQRHIRDSNDFNHSNCLKVLAREYGYEYRHIVAEDHLISRYISHCSLHDYWQHPFAGEFRRARYLLLFDALIETLRDQVPLAEAAEKRGVDFSGFHFSELLFCRISQVLDKKLLPDFSSVQAPGSLIESSWFKDVISFEKSNFSRAKFYNITADPMIRPGVECFRADFSHTDLRGADLRCSYLRGSRFFRAKLGGADFRNANIYECNFTGAEGAFVTGNVSADEWYLEPRTHSSTY